MVLKKFKFFETEEEFTKRWLEDCLVEVCLKCKKEKPIPVVRNPKICDECNMAELSIDEEKQKEQIWKQNMDAKRIPELFRKFDVTKLESGTNEQGYKFDFEMLCQPGISYLIQGDNGTGKTNYACQILKRRAGIGRYYAVEELTKKDCVMEDLKDLPLVIFDDITKFDVSNSPSGQRKLSNFFYLIDYRYSHLKDTIITTNKPLEEIETHFGYIYGPDLVRRFKDEKWIFQILLKTKWESR